MKEICADTPHVDIHESGTETSAPEQGTCLLFALNLHHVKRREQFCFFLLKAKDPEIRKIIKYLLVKSLLHNFWKIYSSLLFFFYAMFRSSNSTR